MSRLRSRDVRAAVTPEAAVPRPARSAAASWLLLALTALAALLGSGLATDAPATRPTSTSDAAGVPAAPLLVVGVVSGAPAAVTSGPDELAVTPVSLALPAPAGSADSSADLPGWAQQAVRGGSGRAPPTTTGT